MLDIFIPISVILLSVILLNWSYRRESITGFVIGVVMIAVSIASIGETIHFNSSKQSKQQLPIIEKHNNNETVITTEDYRIIIQQYKKDLPK